MTQQAVGDELGWSREAVRDYAALKKIASAAWEIVGATIQSATMAQPDSDAPKNGAVAPFTEGLLRLIVSLTLDQQLELVTALAKGDIQKGRFKTLAEN